MRSLLSGVATLAAFAYGCAPTPVAKAVPTPASSPVVGIWRIDHQNTSIEELSKEDRQEQDALRLHIAADNTYRITETRHPDAGKWTFDGDSIRFQSTQSEFPPHAMKLSPDGTRLSVTEKIEGTTLRLTYVKTPSQ